MAAADLVRALRGADVPAGPPRRRRASPPYRGLEAFREEDASLFFGREQDVARILERLRTSRFVAVLGPSGSGKSSLVQAGLLPALRRDGRGDRGWRVLEILPGARPLAALAAQLAHLPGAGAPSPADLAADERALDLAVARALEGRPADERVLIVVDQLEEVFTLCSRRGRARRLPRQPRLRGDDPGRADRRRRDDARRLLPPPRRAPRPARAGRDAPDACSARSTPAACAGPSRSPPAAAAWSSSPASPAASSPTSPTAPAPCRSSSTCCSSSGAAAATAR